MIMNAPFQSDRKKLKILVVDDNMYNADIIRAYLRCFEADIYLAFGGLDAVKFVEDHPDLDIIFMDVNMPGINGVEACIEIKKTHPDIPIVLDTAMNLKTDDPEVLSSGCDDFIVKPFSKEQIVSVVQKFLPAATLNWIIFQFMK